MSHVTVDADRPVRVRIAPSPTGDPHVGTAYVALFNRVFARQHEGRFILRIEDTDQSRATPESESAIFASLGWLGLSWDEGPDVGGEYGPYRQSERTAIYLEHVERLISEGHAYRCFATAEELAEMRAHQKANKLPHRYDRRHRDLDGAEIEERMAGGQPFVVRLRMPVGGETTFVDGLRGEITIRNEEIDDQILLKSDGFPTYHLANVVDDHLMEISHVIRAEEWIPSTPKHVQLYRAFGWESPQFIHLPLLRNEDKSKISKRKNPVSLHYYERVGILPEALVNFLGRMGWSMPDESEKFSLAEMEANFTWAKMGLGGPIFNLQKLDWLNGLYIRELGPEALVDRLMGWRIHREALLELAPLIIERIERLEDVIPMTSYFFGDDFTLDDAQALIPKKRDKVSTYRAMKALTEAIDAVTPWEAEPIEATLRGQCEALEWSPRDLFMPVRLIVTGRKATPPLFETMEVLGKARVQARMRVALKVLKP
jgi:glutamyl-tRNA synthetase